MRRVLYGGAMSLDGFIAGPNGLTLWPGGERRLVAQAGFHGGDVKVL
jgi:hypothetical protein